MDNVDFVDRVIQLMSALNLNQKALSEKLNLSDSFISNVIKRRTKPGFDFFEGLVRMKVNLNWLLTGEGTMFVGPSISKIQDLFPDIPESPDVLDMFRNLHLPFVFHSIIADYLKLKLQHPEVFDEKETHKVNVG